MEDINKEETSQDIDSNEVSEFSYEDYFKSKEAFLIFVLLNVDGEKRAKLLGIEEEMYEFKDKAKEWRNNLVKVLHSDRCKHLNADDATAKVNALYSGMKKYAE
ncbi:hypothetical protein ACIMS2_005419 [Vibrio harveyi]